MLDSYDVAFVAAYKLQSNGRVARIGDFEATAA